MPILLILKNGMVYHVNFDKKQIMRMGNMGAGMAMLMGGGQNMKQSGEDMMKMMGGAMAKSALSDMGIKLDHLAIGSDGSVEVGKKLTEKITFIYVNDEIPQVRVKYQHSPRLESVISADEESNAYDIVYKRDFKSEDFIFSR